MTRGPESEEFLDLAPDLGAELRRAAEVDLEPAAELAKAVSDPTRLSIARTVHLAGELCVGDLARIVQESEKLVSHHLRLLKVAGIVASRRSGKMVMYKVTDVGEALLNVVLPDDYRRPTLIQQVA